MARREKIFRSTMLVTLVIIASKGFGFIRDMVTAGYFGLTMQSDAYYSAYSLFYVPVLLFNSCISATLIPMYTREREQKSLKQADQFASNAINLFAIIAMGVTVAMLLLAEPFVRLVYRGFDPGKVLLTTRLLRVMTLGLAFNVTSISVASLLNARERYVAAQLTGFPLSACVIAASVFFSDRFGVEALAWGVLAANVLQLVILVPFLWGRFSYSTAVDFSDERYHRLLKLALPALLSMGVSELNHQIDHALASGLAEGTIASMSNAYRLVTFLQGILIVPLTTIMFSKMSRHVAEKDEKGALKMMVDSLMTLGCVVLPVVAIAVVLRRDVIQFAYMRGRFRMEDVRVTADILCFYVIGLPAFGMRDFLSRMFHAMQDTRKPFYVSCVVVATNIVLNFILRALMGANGLALATSIAGYVGTVILIVLLRRRFGPIGVRRIAAELVKVLLATAASAVVCLAMNRLLPPAMGTGRVLLRLIACAGASLIVYVAASVALGAKSLRALMTGIRR